MAEVVIGERFCGPKHSGNGGYCAGLFAQGLDGPAEVTLLAPPPLETPIEIRVAGNEDFEAVCDGKLIAKIKPAVVAIDPPAPPSDSAIARAHDDFLKHEGGVHLIPHCFVCGDRRAPGDGLRIFSGPIPGSPVNADFWTPGADLVDETKLVKPEFIWAALDYPSAFALRCWPRLTLLGRFSVDIYRRPQAGERLIAAAWAQGKDGRKHFSSSVIYDEDREIIAAANAVWIELNDPAILAQLEADRA